MSVFQGAERIAAPAPAPAPAPEAKTPDLSQLTNSQLVEICEGRGIEVPRKATKAQLVALLSE